MLLNLCQLTRLAESLHLTLAMAASVVGKCVNPGCEAEFKRLGTGKIYSFPVDKPLAWGLPRKR